MSDILLITPPFTQLNTPYPATPYLKGFLDSKNIENEQMDLGIEVILELFSKHQIKTLFDYAFRQGSILNENAQLIFLHRERYINTIEELFSFLQGNNEALVEQILNTDYLPQAARFEALDDMDWLLDSLGREATAKHIATLYLEDLSDFIINCIDENFGFSRYAERIGRSANTFNELHHALQDSLSYIDKLSIKLLDEKIKKTSAKLICLSVPFPGNLFSAFRCAQHIKDTYPDIPIIMGGGFANTELRSLTEPRVFDYFDYICLDDGELPLELLYKKIIQGEDLALKRTFSREQGKVVYQNEATAKDYNSFTPSYQGLPLDKYISVIEIANPMHSLWSDGKWLKLTMAHGCYWKKCTFCDTSLDYINNYQPYQASQLVNRMESLMAQTGERGFHFVDEAAPPKLMKALAEEIIKRKLDVEWWTNIRFEKSFTAELCTLLAQSGCIAISGGLEVASDRLLKLINKGITVGQVANVCQHFTDAGILVHSYLMYGYPSQTIQETIDSLELVRQLFEQGIIHSGFWHQFALTAHSPIFQEPDTYKIIPESPLITFANNDVEFIDTTGINHEQFGEGLRSSLYNYMQDVGLDMDVRKWFDFKVPKSSINNNYVKNLIN